MTMTDGTEMDAPVAALRASHPQGGTSLHAGFNALKLLEPKPDNIYLLVDGLPTMGDVMPTRPGVNAADRLDHFNRAIRQLPVGVPINIDHVRDGRRSPGGARLLAAVATHGRLDARSVGGLAVRRRRELEVFSMSFLDAICCGFGAIILLFIVSRTSEPGRLEQTERDLDGLIAQYQQELNDIVGETELVRRNEATAATDLRTDKERIDDLQNELETIRLQVLATTEDTELTQETQQRLASARQSLTEEMRRLLADYRPPLEEYKVGGIPVDSEYIIFLIDTSGSMQQYAWDRVQQQLRETLEVYPTVKGIQVMNDEGEYMFKSYRDEWIPDTPTRRQAILDAMKDWDAFSNSNPREGILAAIDKFYDPNKKISLYVYSDDFQQGSINPVVREIDRRNRADASGNRRVRIHAVAFPAVYQMVGELYTAANFATLMRVVCQRNGGTFIALPLITRESRRARD